MAIELSNLTFTEQDDVVPASGVEEIFNTGIANTLAGNDIITSTGGRYSFFNSGTLNTAGGNDIITGTTSFSPVSSPNFFAPNYYGIFNIGSIYTGDSNDIITGINQDDESGFRHGGIYAGGSTIDTGDGNDIITGISNEGVGIDGAFGTINTGDGNDTIAGTTTSLVSGTGIQLFGTCSIDTGKGNDIITGTGFTGGLVASSAAFLNTDEGDDIITGSSITQGFGLLSNVPIDTGDGNDTITGTSGNVDDGDGIRSVSLGITNTSSINTGNGNDIITGIASASDSQFASNGIYNQGGTIDTGNGDAIITGAGTTSGILNQGTINTGNNKDSLISHGQFANFGRVFLGDGNDSIITDTDLPNNDISNYNGIRNYNAIETGDGNDIITSTGVIYNEGVINTGDGADSIIANEGFESAANSSGAWFLGNGDDYIKGYGSGDFYGGNGFDRLELTPGTYTLKKWADNTGESVVFTKGNSLMITSEFEKLIAGGTIYDFTSLTDDQTIFVT